MAEPLMGQIMAFGGNYNPRGWAFCNGALLDVSTYGALYSFMGTFYGGDGRTTFGLPDLCGRSPVGMGSTPGLTPRNIGSYGGSEYVALTTNEMPNHGHTLSDLALTGEVTSTLHAYDGDGDGVNAANCILAKPPAGTTMYKRASSPVVNLGAAAVSTTHNLEVSGSVGNTGGSAIHNNMHPWYCLNYIIALDGLYPSRT